MLTPRNKIFIIPTIIFLIFCNGCNGTLFKNYGRIEVNENITSFFEKYQIDPDLIYYISGSDVYPTSILGINKNYILDTEVWKKIEMTPEYLTQTVNNMRGRLRECCLVDQRGFAVYDDKNNQIGVWYSMLTGAIIVQMKQDRRVVVHPPRDTREYQLYEGKLE